MIEIVGLSKRFDVDTGTVSALDDVNLQLGAAERLGLFGPSGSGKTTLLRCIAGLEVPAAGIIRIDGVEVYNAGRRINLAPWLRPVGVVFQDYALWPHMRVLDNVLFPLRCGRSNTLNGAEQLELAQDVLRSVQLQDHGRRFPSELSGGQRQRVALARALVSRPGVLLMDEPLSSLDPQLRKQTRNELVEILERFGITTIVVSHDHIDGLFMTNTVGIMRRGKLVQVGTPLDVFRRPADVSVAEALDVGAVFRCEKRMQAGSDAAQYWLLDSDQSLLVPQIAVSVDQRERLFMLIPADACCLHRGSTDDCAWQTLVGKVVKESYTGQRWCVLVSIGEVTLEVWEREPPGLKHGDVAHVAVDVRRVRFIPS